ncbi:MAG: PD40 domain-containing protein, partial [Bryobacteraceae bacterium]|nr:PD40 domain-containing protein [Bryobacteraceae bacterium]
TEEGAVEEAPAWSPDGQWIACHRMRPQRPGTLAKAKLGSSAPPVDLIENVDMTAVPEWSPDSEWIACAIVDKPGITLVSPEGKPSRFLPGVSKPLAWSRGGKTIYQVRGTWEDSTLVAIDVVSGKERVIRDLGPLRPDACVSCGWRVSASPDGKNLVSSVMRLRSEIWLLHGLRLLPPWYASLF